MLRASLASTLCLLASCGDGQGDIVIDQDAWNELEAASDPLVTHRPDVTKCDGGWWLEGDLLEVDTDGCNYFSVFQTIPQQLKAGSLLEGALVHDGLTAGESAETHVAILINDTVVWDRVIPIPATPGFISLSVALREDVDPGASLNLHLHNHGANAYRWEPFTIARQ